jgi:hypothetical protein
MPAAWGMVVFAGKRFPRGMPWGETVRGCLAPPGREAAYRGPAGSSKPQHRLGAAAGAQDRLGAAARIRDRLGAAAGAQDRLGAAARAEGLAGTAARPDEPLRSGTRAKHPLGAASVPEDRRGPAARTDGLLRAGSPSPLRRVSAFRPALGKMAPGKRATPVSGTWANPQTRADSWLVRHAGELLRAVGVGMSSGIGPGGPAGRVRGRAGASRALVVHNDEGSVLFSSGKVVRELSGPRSRSTTVRHASRPGILAYRHRFGITA